MTFQSFFLGIDNFIHYHSTSDSEMQSSRDVFKPSVIVSFVVGMEDKYRVSNILLYSSSLRMTAFSYKYFGSISNLSFQTTESNST